MGTVASTDAVTIGFGPSSSAPKRLAAQAQISSTQRVLSLPGFRSTLSLAYGLNIQELGGTLIELVAPDANGVPGLFVYHGRTVITPVGKPNLQLRFGAGARQGQFEFVTPDAMLAIEVRPKWREGDDPTINQALPGVIDLYIVQGEIRWTDPTAQPVQPTSIKAPARLSLGEPPIPGSAAEQKLPEWPVSNDLTDLEKLAAPVVELGTREGALTLKLNELAEDVPRRRSEVRLLAMRCLMLVGDYKPLVEALRDEGQSRNWDSQIETLREACARGPESAKGVKQAFEAHRGPQKGGELFRMLWGYTPDQLKGESKAAALVKALDHDDLDFRVLSYWNLRRIAPKAQSVYRPSDNAAKRRPNVLKWEQLLDKGDLFSKS